MSRMRYALVSLVLLPVSLVACTSGGDSEPVPRLPHLDEMGLASVFEGTVTGGSWDDLRVEVNEVLWQVPKLTRTDRKPLTVVPVLAGTEIKVSVHPDVADVDRGAVYVFVTSQTFGGTPTWPTHALFLPDTMEQVSEREPPLEALLATGESGPQALKAALVALVDNVSARREAERVGDPIPEPSEQLLRAWDYRGM